MKYTELKIECSRDALEILEAELMEAGFDQLTIDDPADMTDILEHRDWYKYDYIADELLEDAERNPVITMYFADDEEGRAELARFKEVLGSAKLPADAAARVASEKLTDDEDWLYKWQEYFKPTKVGKRIVVKPTWEEYEPAEDELVIKIDPGMAFGTGTHETTSMCIKALEKYIPAAAASPDAKVCVLDVGCGSGILSVAAALLGSDDCLGIDIDPDAVRVSNENIALNKMEGNIRVQEGDLTKGVDYEADIVVANLMAELVVMLTPDVRKHLRQGGVYISSGILNEKEEMVSAALRGNGFEITEVLHDGEWCAIVAK